MEEFLILKKNEQELTIALQWASEFPEIFSRELEVDPVSLTARLSGGGEERDAPLVNFQTSFPLAGLKNGAYELNLYGRRGDESVCFWKQFVYVQHALKRTPEEVDRIARLYAPVLLFSTSEEFFPVSMKELVIDTPPHMEGSSIEVQTVLGNRTIAFSDLDRFLRTNGNSEYLLNQSAFGLTESSFYQTKGSYQKSVVYYSYIEGEGDSFYINYHTFYAFDPKTGIAKFLNVGPHVFDRESLTLEFESSDRPTRISLGAHLENQPIFFLEKLLGWTEGRTTVDFNHVDTPLILTHPVVAVAEGSHALYPSAGTFHISVLTEVAGHIFHNLLHPDQGEHDMSAHQALLPPTLQSKEFAAYDLRPLRLDLLQSDPHPETTPLYDPATGALVFSGYWVDVPGFQNERFPPFSKREMEIRDWVDNGFPWNWEVPEGVRANNKAIVDYITERILE